MEESTLRKKSYNNMQISVVIPAYNAERTIKITLDSVLSQTVAPHQILVFDDGSTDNTALILESYKPHVTVFRQSNQGVAHARNYLCERATGDIIAFLDADDVWHPCYLEVQSKLIKDYPEAIAYFTGHITFSGYGNYQWDIKPLDVHPIIELIDPLSFLKRYNELSGLFYPSFCCVPKRVLREIGKEPFEPSLIRAEDCYFFNLIASCGSFVYSSALSVAYRVTEHGLSADLLKLYRSVVHAFELLDDHYRKLPDVRFSKTFRFYFASHRRYYAKILMGAGQIPAARRQFSYSTRNTSNPLSIAKSLVFWFLTYMPAPLQPRWYSSFRQWPYVKRPLLR